MGGPAVTVGVGGALVTGGILSSVLHEVGRPEGRPTIQGVGCGLITGPTSTGIVPEHSVEVFKTMMLMPASVPA